jgi:DegV family protein with EDD domain
LAPEVVERYQIPVIPQIINFGNDSYQEGVDLDIATFMRKLRAASELPKTAAPPPELFSEVYRRLAPLGQPILCIHPSAEVSGTVRSASVAAMDFPEADIRVIDTRLIASPLGTLVTLAAQWAAQGMTASEIQERLAKLSPRCHIYFMVETLEYLARGGRIGGASALFGSLLQIKPILTFHDGRVDQFEKERTHKRAVARLKELVLTQISRPDAHLLSVMHAGVPDEARQIAADLAQALDLSEIPIADVPPAIVTHGGPGVIGVGFFA